MSQCGDGDVPRKFSRTVSILVDWRTGHSCIGVNTFCYTFPLKSTNGDSEVPLATHSHGTIANGTLLTWSGAASNSAIAGSFKSTSMTWASLHPHHTVAG